MQRLVVCVLASLALVGCSNKETKKDETVLPVRKVETGPSIEAKQAAIENGDDLVAEVKFAPGTATLNEEARTKLEKILQTAVKNGTIKKVEVISWSDHEYPTKQQKKLSSADLDLAKRRNVAVESFVKAHTKEKSQKETAKLQTYNMAERPGGFESILGNSGTRLKDSLEKAGISSTEASSNSSPKASRSIVMIKLEGTKK